jgi:hypothetical protein
MLRNLAAAGTAAIILIKPERPVRRPSIVVPHR